MSPFVVDASAIVPWLVTDEPDERKEAVIARLQQEGAVVPALFPYEIRNVLVVAERRGRISREESDASLIWLGSFAFSLDEDAELGPVLELARRHRLTFYDAAYLDLAVRLGADLATLDDELRDAANAVAVDVIPA